METAEKPKIESKSAAVRVPRHGALIAREKRALPELTKQIEKKTSQSTFKCYPNKTSLHMSN